MSDEKPPQADDAPEEAELDAEGESKDDDIEAEGDPSLDAEESDTSTERKGLRRSAARALKLAQPKAPPRVREYILPLLTLATLTLLLAQFRTVLLPFILACLLVYLMEPIVSRIGRTPEKPNGLPRWVAVILVYIVFIGVVATSVVTIVPRFVGEFVRLGDTLPDVVQEFRQESLPVIDEKVQGFIESYLPSDGGGANFDPAASAIQSARVAAASQALATAQARASVRSATQLKIASKFETNADGSGVLQHVIVPAPPVPPPMVLADSVSAGEWRFAEEDEGAIRIVPDRNGDGFNIYLNAVEVEVEEESKRWVVRPKEPELLPKRRESASSAFNLQKSLDEVVGELVDTSTERIASIIEFAQTLVVGVVQAFVALVLTLMVAAFVSIDLYRVKRFFRTMVPESGRHGFDVFLKMADRGLSGVVRGQLLICLVNGVLTYVGLVIIGVKFSVLLGVVAGILSLIPVFGTVLSTVPIVLIGLTDGFTTGLLALGWILLIHFVEANFLNPKIIGSAAHIHPVIVIFALLAGESAYGLVGALLAVPTASLILTVFNFVRKRAWRPSQEESEVTV